MAQIDLKHATVILRDGSSNTANTTTTSATGAVGATTLAITALVSPLSDGEAFKLHSDLTLYTAVGEHATGATTLRFEPPLAVAVTSGETITFSYGGNEVEIRIGEGNVTYTEKRNIEYRKNRGRLDTVREGDEEPIEVGFDFVWEYLRSDTGEPVTIEEALKKTGNASSWVTSSPDPCEPYCVDVVIHYVSPCSGFKDEVIVLPEFRWETLDHNLKDGAVAVKGNCNVTLANITRVAATVFDLTPTPTPTPTPGP